MNYSVDYFLTTLNCVVCPFSNVMLKMYIPASNESVLNVAAPDAKESVVFATTFPAKSVTINVPFSVEESLSVMSPEVGFG